MRLKVNLAEVTSPAMVGSLTSRYELTSDLVTDDHMIFLGRDDWSEVIAILVEENPNVSYEVIE